MLNQATYLLLDAARMGEQMDIARRENKTHDSLYRGGKEAKLSSVAPYIFQYSHGKPFGNWFLHQGWGDSWGIMIRSTWPMIELHKHFRKFLMVTTEEGKQLYFRFYDPRVLRLFLPTCTPGQLIELFGQLIEYIILEDEDPAFALRFWQEKGVLRKERFAVTELIAALPEPGFVKEQLPPETIAALKEQGKLEEVLAAMNGTPFEPAPLKPTIVPDPLAASSIQSMEEESSSPKPKTRWNMFD
jgi:hypothetical protein